MNSAGDKVGGFELLRSLGEGPFGIVWLASDVNGTPAALKLLKPNFVKRHAGQAAFNRLLSSIRVHQQLRHEGLAAVYGPLEDTQHGALGMVTEFAEGRAMAQVRLPAQARHGEDPRSLATLLRWFEELTDVLGWLHAQGMVHGNLKPNNIMLVRSPTGHQLKILDLPWSAIGLAAPPPGQPTFLAPEQVKGGAPSPTSDQWSVASLLHRILTSDDPRSGLAGFPTALVVALQRATRERPEERFSEVGLLTEALQAARLEVEQQGAAAGGTPLPMLGSVGPGSGPPARAARPDQQPTETLPNPVFAPPGTAAPPPPVAPQPPVAQPPQAQTPGYPPQGAPGYPPPGYPPQGAPGYPPPGYPQYPGYPPQGAPGYPPPGYPQYPGYAPAPAPGYPPGYPPQGAPGYPPPGYAPGQVAPPGVMPGMPPAGPGGPPQASPQAPPQAPPSGAHMPTPGPTPADAPHVGLEMRRTRGVSVLQPEPGPPGIRPGGADSQEQPMMRHSVDMVINDEQLRPSKIEAAVPDEPSLHFDDGAAQPPQAEPGFAAPDTVPVLPPVDTSPPAEAPSAGARRPWIALLVAASLLVATVVGLKVAGFDVPGLSSSTPAPSTPIPEVPGSRTDWPEEPSNLPDTKPLEATESGAALADAAADAGAAPDAGLAEAKPDAVKPPKKKRKKRRRKKPRTKSSASNSDKGLDEALARLTGDGGEAASEDRVACDEGDAAACVAEGRHAVKRGDRGSARLAYDRACKLGSAPGCFAAGAQWSKVSGQREKAIAAFSAACGRNHRNGCEAAAKLLHAQGGAGAKKAEVLRQKACVLGLQAACRALKKAKVDTPAPAKTSTTSS